MAISVTNMVLLIVTIQLILISCHSTVAAETRKSHKVTEIGENWDNALVERYRRDLREASEIHSRRKRAFEPSPSEIQLHLDLHNGRRRMEGASNMEFMEWNSVLSDMAGAWADLCIWAHGQPEGFDPPYNGSLGQNLYIINNVNLPFLEVINRSMIGFYDQEKPFYNFETTECVEGKQCGHYTQVVWADSVLVGCAIGLCEGVPENLPPEFAGSLYLVCNFAPAGNVHVLENGVSRQLDPYKIGPACTECASGNFWCDDGLCRSKESCDSTGTSCTCEASCNNCGTLNEDTCSCTCPRGFTGHSCSDVCMDNHEWCGVSPGWPSFWCENPETPYVKEYCLEMCGVCETLGEGESPVTCEPTTTTTTTTTTTPTPTTTTTTTTTTPTPTTTTTTTTTPTPTTTTTTTTTTPTPTTTTTTVTPTTPTTATTTSTTTTPTTTTTTTPTPTTTTATTPTTPTTTTATPTTATTATTTTSTTSTTPTTTTTTTTTERDCTGFCQNGATTSLVNNQCECQCTAAWQGDMCDERRDEARVGIVISILARIQVFNIIWEAYLQPALVASVNSWCNVNVMHCCPGADILRSDQHYTFSTEEGVVIGQGYPKEYRLSTNLWRTVGMFYVYGAEGNDLCKAALDTSVSNRRKRSLPDMTLSQDSLETIVMSMSQNLSAMLLDCCNVTIESIERSVVYEVTSEEPTTTETPFLERMGPFGLELYIWILAAVGVGAVLIIILSICICCCCMKRTRQQTRDKYAHAEAARGFDNRAYHNHANEIRYKN